MNKKILLLAILALSGCADTMERIDREQAERKAAIEAENSALISRVVEAEMKGSMICIGKEMCDKAFKFTKLYIMQNSDFKIARSDDMSISTHSYNIYNRDLDYRVRFSELVYMSAVKIPIKAPEPVKDVKDIEKIIIKADCGEYHEPYRTGTPRCVDKAIEIYNGFKPFIESQM